MAADEHGHTAVREPPDDPEGGGELEGSNVMPGAHRPLRCDLRID